ncbi:MAG TPA: hypothetical protein VNO43_05060 [Candidatus Eisenbacteria bacterium]|nr:hypothetical protein [Candidatus Eisenbacteria bacterium]
MTGLLERLGRWLLPERYVNGDLPPRDVLQALVSVGNKLLQLAAQIEAHADMAPYPHIARRLRQLAEGKRKRAEQLRILLGSHGNAIREVPFEVFSGKNHWERMQRDLTDQKELEHSLALSEPRVATDLPELAQELARLRAAEAADRDLLTSFMATADPQATQT